MSHLFGDKDNQLESMVSDFNRLSKATITYGLIRGELHIQSPEFPYWRKATHNEKAYFEATRNLKP